MRKNYNEQGKTQSHKEQQMNISITVISRDSVVEYEDVVGFFVKDGWFVMERKDGSRTIIPNNCKRINIPKGWQE